MSEPIVSRAAIRKLANDAVAANKDASTANPYEPGTVYHQTFEESYWREVAGRIAQGTADLYARMAAEV